MISVAEARAAILDGAAPIAAETVPITAAAGRVLRETVAARRTQPPFDATAMDGYAVRAADAAAGARLRVVAEIAAGDARERMPLGPGDCARIFTGAPMPPGADGVLLQEDADRDGDAAIVRETVVAGRWIRPRGMDFAEGETLLEGPRRLSAEDVAVAAAAGRSWLSVSAKPRVALIAIGDELRLPGDALDRAAIVSSNQFGVAALLERAGAACRLAPLIADDLQALRAEIRANAGSDVIVTLGGASDGDHDLARPAFAAEGAPPAFYKIAMRPGKPLMAARLGRALVVGLPGNPVSALVCARLFLVPLIERLSGLAGRAPTFERRPLAAPVAANGPREHYMRARLVRSAENDEAVDIFEDQDSSRLALLARADALVRRPVGDPALRAGDLVEVLRLRP